MHQAAITVCLFVLLALCYMVGTSAFGTDKRPGGEKWGAAELKTLQVRRTTGPGCPYAAAWLTHVSLFCATGWYMESTKMETHTFNIFRGNTAGYQLVDPFVYSVNHMSMFEHWAHKKSGFGDAVKQSFIMSNASYYDQCFGAGYQASLATEFVAMIPFYGGLPPNVTAGNLVRSIGQGNSLVNAETKALQAMAALCSIVKYFGQTIIGVANLADRTLMLKEVSMLICVLCVVCYVYKNETGVGRFCRVCMSGGPPRLIVLIVNFACFDCSLPSFPPKCRSRCIWYSLNS
jgi:hypothetical protein